MRRARARKATRARADQVLAAVDLVPLDPDVVEWARRQAPPTLWALDAIRIGSALSLGSALGALLTYDRRQREAARDAGITTVPD